MFFKKIKAALRRLFDRNKNNKTLYYTENAIRMLVPRAYYRQRLKLLLSTINEQELPYIKSRLNYYNKLSGKNILGPDVIRLSAFKLKGRSSAYFFDANYITRYFNGDLKVHFLFGDVTHLSPVPVILKSRPIGGNNTNSVLLNLNKVRHFVFSNDKYSFSMKKDLLVWRGNASQQHRIKFLKMYFDHPLCDIGQVGIGNAIDFGKNYMTINDQLRYKFILCIEGNDVATNLKWVMSSHSVAVMPRPKYETWFMEGKLEPGVHYVEIKDDFSDLEEKLNYYINHPQKAECISRQANAYTAQFRNRKREKLIGLLVLQKYFYCTGQTDNFVSALFK